jgi:phosphate acetyltransferase
MLSSAPFVCPPDLLEKARRHPPIATAVAGAESPVALESARLAAEAGLIEPVLIGDARAITATAADIGWDISKLRVIATSDDEAGAAGAATALARGGEVAAVMKGHIHTDALMRAVIDRDQGLRTGRRISHVFYMTAPERDGALCITDAAINVSPDIDTRLDIIRNAGALFNALNDNEAKVALLSASEVPSAVLPSSVEAEETAKRAADEVPGVVVEGPLAFDLAVSPAAAAIKGFASAVAGAADILVVPNIETGNALVKAMVHFMSATAAGLVLGAAVPIILTSRADPPEARLAAAALAAIVAGAGEGDES